jgi:cell wall-associated NlpC family hydrolase
MSDSEETLAIASKRAAIVSAVGVVLVIASLIYSTFRIVDIENEVNEKQALLKNVSDSLAESKTQWRSLKDEVVELRSTQDNILKFLTEIVDGKKVNLLDADVAWSDVQRGVDAIGPGARKQAILTAILLAWKDIPFAMGQSTPNQGFDSPRFLAYVLEKNGVRIQPRPNERLSDALMRICTRVDKPRPGDLVFYKGQVGSFGFLYLADDQPFVAGIGVGTLQAIEPLQIMRLANVNTPYFPLIGYYRVPYPGEA